MNKDNYFLPGSSCQKIQALLLLPLVFFEQRTFCAFVWKWLALIERPNILTGLNIKLLFIPCTISPDTGMGMALINRNVGVARDLFLVFSSRTQRDLRHCWECKSNNGTRSMLSPLHPLKVASVVRAVLWFPPTSVRRSYPISPGGFPMRQMIRCGKRAPSASEIDDSMPGDRQPRLHRDAGQTLAHINHNWVIMEHKERHL